MEGCRDFIQWLGPDISIKILMCLEDPSDIVRVSSVSTSWHQFVVANSLSKQLCLRIFPEISSVAHVIEVNNMIEPEEVKPANSMEWEYLGRDHRIYAFLARALTSFMRKCCMLEAICASSTDNYPEESIQNTLEPSDRVEHRASFWSSKGESDPAVPETLVYKLIANLCVITEVHVQPFQAYFQIGFPIYSAKAVRFRIGHPKFPMDIENDVRDESLVHQESAEDKFIWTYTSPEFQMAQYLKIITAKMVYCWKIGEPLAKVHATKTYSLHWRNLANRAPG
uniref:F-box domain-containing protein n=1 Tax=Davidia involucrata TaxID=16924 RepID=A0A5B6Z189_DAVIN